MNIREEIQPWIVDALRANGGRGTITQVARHVWQNHESDLRSSDDIFYNWQYDMRWAAGKLRAIGKMKAADASPKGIWMLASN